MSDSISGISKNRYRYRFANHEFHCFISQHKLIRLSSAEQTPNTLYHIRFINPPLMQISNLNRWIIHNYTTMAINIIWIMLRSSISYEYWSNIGVLAWSLWFENTFLVLWIIQFESSCSNRNHKPLAFFIYSIANNTFFSIPGPFLSNPVFHLLDGHITFRKNCLSSR